jgi:uncharacterized protein YndB with AHSA1/START domain
VLVQRLLSAPPAVVYDEWLDPEALSDWMCPWPARATTIDLEPTIGGSLRIEIEENGVRFDVMGRFVELDRPRRLSFTWSCSTLEPINDETLMTIQHALLPPEFVNQHQAGWAQIAEQLATKLAADLNCPSSPGRWPLIACPFGAFQGLRLER